MESCARRHCDIGWGRRVRAMQRMVLVAGILITAATAHAQTGVRVRGTIVPVDGNVLSVKARDVRDVKLTLADDLTVAVARAARFEDIRVGDHVGSATLPGANGVPVAIEVHYLAPTVPDGQGAWDLQSGSSMTNANVASIVLATGQRELTLQFKGATQTIVVPEGAPIVRAVPGTRADLVPGEYVFVAAQVGDGGALTAARIQVSKDGIKPPQ